jgi:hypothetical protein
MNIMHPSASVTPNIQSPLSNNGLASKKQQQASAKQQEAVIGFNSNATAENMLHIRALHRLAKPMPYTTGRHGVAQHNLGTATELAPRISEPKPATHNCSSTVVNL